MKKIALRFISTAIILATVCLSSHAQDAYRLFRPSVQYMYSNPAAASSYTASVLGMRLGSQVCETTYISAQVSPTSSLPDGCIQQVSAFIGSQVCHTETTTELTIAIDGQNNVLTLRQQAPIGDSWLAMVGLNNIFARVEAVVEESFLGLTDSVKHIALYRETSTGSLAPLYEEMPLKISKNYGLITGVFLHWLGVETGQIELLGMSEPQVGLQNPSRETIFRLAEGDQIHTYFQQTVNGNQQFYSENQARIVGVWWNTDNTILNYAFRADRKQYYSGMGASTDTTYLEDDVYFGEVNWNNVLHLDLQPGAVFPDPSIPSSVRVIEVIPNAFCGQAGKRLQRPMLAPIDSCYMPWLDVNPGPTYYNQLDGPYFNWVDISGFHIRELRYVSREDGFTCGNPFDFTVATQSPRLASFHFYPNPATDHIRLEWEAAETASLSLQLFSTQGQLLQSYPRVLSGRTISLPNLPTGLYVLHCQTEAGYSWIEKVLIE